MKQCWYWRRRIPEAVYGELDEKTRAGLEGHCSACPACARLYEGMAGAIRRMEARPAPDRSPEFWAGYWDRLESRMAREEAGSAQMAPRRRMPRLAWVYGAAAVLLVSLGILIGRTVFRPGTGAPFQARTVLPRTAPDGRIMPQGGSVEPALDTRTSRYLRRSRTLLLAVINTDPNGEDPLALGLPLQKRTSEELLQESTVLRKQLGGSDPRLERLVSDLQMILLQIANLKPDPDAGAIEIIKAGVESGDLLFKIDLREVRRPAGPSGDGIARRPGKGNSSPGAARMAAGA